jgi:hypothetical protein
MLAQANRRSACSEKCVLSSTVGATPVTLTLRYSDGSSTPIAFTLSDWVDPLPASPPTFFKLIDKLRKWDAQDNINDLAVHGIVGVSLSPDTSKPLLSVRIAKTGGSGQYLTFLARHRRRNRHCSRRTAAAAPAETAELPVPVAAPTRTPAALPALAAEAPTTGGVTPNTQSAPSAESAGCALVSQSGASPGMGSWLTCLVVLMSTCRRRRRVLGPCGKA